MRSSKTSSENQKPSVLPLPLPVREHHQESMEKILSQWKKTGEMAPVWLITGPSGIGKRSLCFHLAQWVLCESPLAEGPCEQCASCLRARHGNWINFKEISADEDEGQSGNLKVEQFRQLKSSVGFGAYEGRYRITLIRDVDHITLQAANSLLKILEEPPPGWIFFLTAADPSLVLPTLVSRCQVTRLRPFSRNSLTQILEQMKVPTDRREICARLAQGSWGRALSLAEDETWEKRQAILRFFNQPRTELSALVDWAAQESTHLVFLLDWFEQVLSELIQGTLDKNHAGSMDRSVASIFKQYSDLLGSPQNARRFWLICVERLFHTRQDIFTPVNKRLLVQSLLLPWLDPISYSI